MSITEKILPEDLTTLGGFLKKTNWAFIVLFAIFSLSIVSIVISEGGLINFIFLIPFVILIVILLYNNKLISDRIEGFERFYCDNCKDYFYAHKPRSKNKSDVYCSDCGTRLDTPIEFIKGRKFEDFVENKFGDGFRILHRTPRYEEKERYASKYPDLLIQSTNPRGKESFFVEAKYRSKANNGKVNVISNPIQLNRFRKISKDMNYRLFFQIGLGGEPHNPDELFVVPIDDMNQTDINLDILRHYKGYKNKAYYDAEEKKLY